MDIGGKNLPTTVYPKTQILVPKKVGIDTDVFNDATSGD